MTTLADLGSFSGEVLPPEGEGQLVWLIRVVLGGGVSPEGEAHLVVHHGIPYYTMADHGMPWYAMAYHYSMVYHG